MTTIWSGSAAAGLYLGTGLILALLVHTYYPGALGMREWIRVVLSWLLGKQGRPPGGIEKAGGNDCPTLRVKYRPGA